MSVPSKPITGYYIVVNEHDEFLTHADTFSACLSEAKLFLPGDYLGVKGLAPIFLFGTFAIYIDLEKTRTYNYAKEEFNR